MSINNDIDALKQLYSKMGGTLADVANINTSSEMIAKISDVVGGDGDSSGDSGNGIVIVHITPTGQGDYVCDKTAQEIVDLLENGTVVFGYSTPFGYGIMHRLYGPPYAMCECSMAIIRNNGDNDNGVYYIVGDYFRYDDTNGITHKTLSIDL